MATTNFASTPNQGFAGTPAQAAEPHKLDPLEQQMRFAELCKTNFLYPASEIENDELAERMNTSISLARIANELGKIVLSMRSMSVNIASEQQRKMGSKPMVVVQMDDLERVFTNVFNLQMQMLSKEKI